MSTTSHVDGETGQPDVSTHRDPLLACLERVAGFHHLPFNEPSVVAGLPLENGRLTPGLLLRAARRLGLKAEVVRRRVKRLPKAVLPAILLLRKGRAVVAEPDAEGNVFLFKPGDTVDSAELKHSHWIKKDYSGYAILFQAVAEETGDASPHRPEFDSPRARRWWFWRTMWRFRRFYSQLLPGSILVNLFALAMPFFIMLVYDRVVPNEAQETLWVLAAGVTIVFIFEFLIRLLRGHVIERAGKEIDQVLASSLYEQLLAIELQARPASAGVLSGRMKAYETLREFFMSASLLALTDVPFGLLMIGVVFYIAGPVGWVLVGASILAILVETVLQAPLRKAVSNSVATGVERQAFISETVNALETVKACNAEGELQRKLERMMRQSSVSEVRSHWYSLLGNSTTTLLMHMTTVGIVITSVFRVHAGEMSMGAMIACVMLGARSMAPMAMVAGLMTRLQYALESLRGLNMVMAMPRETGDGRQFLRRRSFELKYELRNVTARYPNQPLPALEGASLAVEPGERIAVVGKIGSGKSTLLRLMAKLYEPSGGEILLDGVDISQYHPASVREWLGYLPQDSVLFLGTLRENLLLGSAGADDEAVLEAVRLAGLEEMINRHPLGFEMPVGERGVLLSGGQRQAVALARTLVSRPRLLLLDEPTAAMDLQAEKKIIQSLKRYLDASPARAVVMVTHKFSMLDLADRLLVIDEGKVVADGEREAVLEKLKTRAREKAAGAAAPAGDAVAARELSERAN